jgi:hypothetical protein
MDPDPGLCGHCQRCQVVTTARSRFYLCRRSFTDSHYRKYPVLPVRVCPGHEEGAPVAADRVGREDPAGSG